MAKTALELLDRMEALVRRMAGPGDVMAMTREAQAIVAELPDTDISQARQLIGTEYGDYSGLGRGLNVFEISSMDVAIITGKCAW